MLIFKKYICYDKIKRMYISFVMIKAVLNVNVILCYLVILPANRNSAY